MSDRTKVPDFKAEAALAICCDSRCDCRTHREHDEELARRMFAAGMSLGASMVADEQNETGDMLNWCVDRVHKKAEAIDKGEA